MFLHLHACVTNSFPRSGQPAEIVAFAVTCSAGWPILASEETFFPPFCNNRCDWPVRHVSLGLNCTGGFAMAITDLSQCTDPPSPFYPTARLILLMRNPEHYAILALSCHVVFPNRRSSRARNFWILHPHDKLFTVNNWNHGNSLMIPETEFITSPLITTESGRPGRFGVWAGTGAFLHIYCINTIWRK